jgi:hypothetical protein
MIEGNQPCICGHIKDFHTSGKDGCSICWALAQRNYIFVGEGIICKKFKLNNLLYLEKCYEANHK